MKLGHNISSLQILSKHIDLILRSNNQNSHNITTTFNKKNNQIYLRGKLCISAIGKQVFPVLIKD